MVRSVRAYCLELRAELKSLASAGHIGVTKLQHWGWSGGKDRLQLSLEDPVSKTRWKFIEKLPYACLALT